MGIASNGGKNRRAGKFVFCLMVSASGWATAAPVFAQVPTTVQLPTVSSFSASTSVLVPDRGSLLLGGVDRVSDGLSSRGVPGASHLPGGNRLFRNQALGRDASHSSARASVWIHDFQAMDEALLAEASALRRDRQLDTSQSATGSFDAVRRNRDARSSMARSEHHRVNSRPTELEERAEAVESVAEIRRQRAREQERADAEARELLKQGDQAMADGKPGVARIYYQMAQRRSTGPIVVPTTGRPLDR